MVWETIFTFLQGNSYLQIVKFNSPMKKNEVVFAKRSISLAKIEIWFAKDRKHTRSGCLDINLVQV